MYMALHLISCGLQMKRKQTSSEFESKSPKRGCLSEEAKAAAATKQQLAALKNTISGTSFSDSLVAFDQLQAVLTDIREGRAGVADVDKGTLISRSALGGCLHLCVLTVHTLQR